MTEAADMDSKSMTHIAIAEALKSEAVEWLEKVSDEEYSR